MKVEKKIHELADQIAESLNYDNDKKAVIAYGLIALIQTVTILIAISAIGLLFGFFWESLLIFFTVGLIKKSTGGAHSETLAGCMIVSIISVIILSIFAILFNLLTINRSVYLILSLLEFVFCLIVFVRRVPVDSPNKPINKPEKMRRLRMQSFILLFVCFAVSVVCFFLSASSTIRMSLSVSIQLAVLWQTIMLTPSGIRSMQNVDLLLSTLRR